MRPIKPIDDKRLYRIADRSDGYDLSWPVFATPVVDNNDQKFLLIQPALPINTKEQHEFLVKRVGVIAVEELNGRWLVREKTFSSISLACRGCTPEYYLSWPGEKDSSPGPTEVPNVPEVPKDPVGDDFVRFTANYLGADDIGQARIWWNAFCFNAVRWMLEKGKPLPMGFCTLHAFPYRANWKGIIHARWPNLAAIFNKPRQARDAALEAVGIHECLIASDFIEMYDENVFGWTLEAVPEKSFENTCKRTEDSYRAECNKPVDYLFRWNKLVKLYEKQIIKVLASWLDKAARPLAGVDESLPVDQQKLAPRRSRGRVTPAPAPVPKAYFTTAAYHPADQPTSKAILDEGSAETVQDMPDANISVQLVRPHVSDRVGRKRSDPGLPMSGEPGSDGPK